MFNLCSWQGVEGSNTDFLICAVAEHLDLSILTTDQDFRLFQAIIHSHYTILGKLLRSS